jgi:hypothetical protein
MPGYEVYVQRFRITEWRNGAVFRTEPLEHGWHDKSVADANRPRESGIIYAAASDDFARTHMTIRVKKEGTP